ncbi:cupin domain-containing protein [Streptomyces sp. NEAU-Y11]|uniref:cupin domain-containing protein n=1 Tax=Streptomyces cucumeris TaxID=2962890 RepID=UPI0020C87D5E|nr:cupin domain-containing protein [Streptomyces sp. NEAU-Y11]MCP9211487.1 cupin domain-containing protein [Streptomyces sp. NEAU-Y11]
MATVVRGERRPFGPIANDTSGPAVTHRQVGGEGVCRWKMLMNGMHLEGEWNCVEYVVIEPGSSVGEHIHLRTEEIYYIVSGRAVVTMDGQEIEVRAGDLVTTPIGSAHSIANRSDEDMHFFVSEVFPGQGPTAKPSRLHVPDLLPPGTSTRVAHVDLTPHFTGDWRQFRLLDVAQGDRVDEQVPPDCSIVLHVLEGAVVIAIGDDEYAGSPGLSVAAPPKYAYRLVNTGNGPLRVISTEVGVA